MNSEFRKLLLKLCAEPGGPTDFACVAAARRHGFDPQELWDACARVTRMVEDDSVWRFESVIMRAAARLRRQREGG